MVRLNQRAPRERSAIADIITGTRTSDEIVVYADCILTRRKRHHMICDTIDSVLFRTRWWSDVLEWLAREGIERYTIVTDRDRYAVEVRNDHHRSKE